MWAQYGQGASGKASGIGLMLLVWLAAGGCSSGGSGISHGVFVDSAVEGLTFNTETVSGETDSQGRFSFEPGETVTFSIGGITLGSVRAKSIITPLDLVAVAQDEKNQAVTNIVRFLITLDEDGDPENGITISPDVSAAFEGISIAFDQDPEKFSLDADVMNVLGIVRSLEDGTGKKMLNLCTAQEAQDHLAQTIAGLKDKGYEHRGGSGGGGSGGGGCGG